jgi:hypothetical protein
MSIAIRVPGFLPTINGLHFTNSWPPGMADYTFSVLGQTIRIGDASNGLCGGMVYTVKDLFETRLLPPADTALPGEGSPLFNYIVARLTHSFDEDDVNQYLSWIQMSDHDTALAHGLAWHEITEEWPKIKEDLDAGVLSPLGLVHGQEPPTIGFFTGMQDLGGCHQVLAWGYDLDGSSLTIHIYDPNGMGDEETLTLDIGNPTHTTPITVSSKKDSPGFYRGFFRTHYTYRDPLMPVSAAFIVTVVSSPGIVPAGPVPLTHRYPSFSVVSRYPELDIFGLGMEKGMFHKAWNGNTWLPSEMDWEPLGGCSAARPRLSPGVPTGSTFLASVRTKECFTSRGMTVLGFLRKLIGSSWEGCSTARLRLFPGSATGSTFLASVWIMECFTRHGMAIAGFLRKPIGSP